MQDAWVYGENVRKIANAPRVLEVPEILYRRKAFPFQALNPPHNVGRYESDETGVRKIAGLTPRL